MTKCIDMSIHGKTESTREKYGKRNSPPYPANDCEEGEIKFGQHRHSRTRYIVSAPNAKGVKVWRKLEESAKSRRSSGTKSRRRKSRSRSRSRSSSKSKSRSRSKSKSRRRKSKSKSRRRKSKSKSRRRKSKSKSRRRKSKSKSRRRKSK